MRERGTLNIQCLSNQILILESAYYGFIKKKKQTNCGSDVLEHLSTGKRITYIKVKVTNDLLTDTCFGKGKTLVVSYNCEKSTQIINQKKKLIQPTKTIENILFYQCLSIYKNENCILNSYSFTLKKCLLICSDIKYQLIDDDNYISLSIEKAPQINSCLN